MINTFFIRRILYTDWVIFRRIDYGDFSAGNEGAGNGGGFGEDGGDGSRLDPLLVTGRGGGGGRKRSQDKSVIGNWDSYRGNGDGGGGGKGNWIIH